MASDSISVSMMESDSISLFNSHFRSIFLSRTERDLISISMIHRRVIFCAGTSRGSLKCTTNFRMGNRSVFLSRTRFPAMISSGSVK